MTSKHNLIRDNQQPVAASRKNEPDPARAFRLRGDAQHQFSTTPRFQSRSHAKHNPPHPVVSSGSHSTSLAEALAEARSTFNVGPDTTNLAQPEDNESAQLLPRTAKEDVTVPKSHAGQWTHRLTLSPKRHRSDAVDPNEHPAAKHQKRSVQRTANIFQPSHTPEPPKRRFTHSATPSDHILQASTFTRPSFLSRPATAQPDEAFSPLPDAFSPHRRGPKFVPGGMAETLHKWTIEMGQTALLARRAQMRGMQETFVMELRVTERLSSSGNRLIMITGTIDDGRSVNALLIDANTSDHNLSAGATCTIGPGQVIGLREPCWSVDACDKQWVVCVDWKMMGS